MPPWHLQDTLRKFTDFCRIDTAVAVRRVSVGQHFQDECPLELVSVWRFHVQQSFNTGEQLTCILCFYMGLCKGSFWHQECRKCKRGEQLLTEFGTFTEPLSLSKDLSDCSAGGSTSSPAPAWDNPNATRLTGVCLALLKCRTANNSCDQHEKTTGCEDGCAAAFEVCRRSESKRGGPSHRGCWCWCCRPIYGCRRFIGFWRHCWHQATERLLSELSGIAQSGGHRTTGEDCLTIISWRLCV